MKIFGGKHHTFQVETVSNTSIYGILCLNRLLNGESGSWRFYKKKALGTLGAVHK